MSCAAGSNSAELALMLTVASLSAAPAYADVDDAVTTAVDSVKVRWHGDILLLLEYRRCAPHRRPPLLNSTYPSGYKCIVQAAGEALKVGKAAAEGAIDAAGGVRILEPPAH